ncbi:MAG: poly-gamma-glutamate synthase PgsB [Myxococcota bacterium]
MALPFAIGALLVLLIGLGVVERARLHRHRSALPVRIHVNGTRGKSSVVRLLAAALRADGRRVFAKTTGSLPRLITPDGTELPVHRPGLTNVIEQLRILGLAARENADVLVIECMALQPALQSLCELEIVRATHGVICNAWPDHLDVMGPTDRDVALALAGTTPVGGVLFSAEREHRALFEAACRDRGSEFVGIGDAEVNTLSDAEMARFDYIEHRENVALTLAVCEQLGVDREVALAGMAQAEPDVGALREAEVRFFGRRLQFVNGFAANDPIATERVWRLALARHPDPDTRVMVLNCRLDRPDRSRQLGEALPAWPLADHYFLVGSGTYALARTAVGAGLPATRLTPLEGEGAADVFEEILGVAGRHALVVGAGNIAGIGLDLHRYFQRRATLTDAEQAA